MNKAIIVNSLKDAIIDTFCEFIIIQDDNNQHLIGKTAEGYIDIDKTWANALSNFEIDYILKQIDYHCDQATIVDHWQQTALDIIDEDDLSEDEFNYLLNSDAIEIYYLAAMYTVVELVKEHFKKS